MSLSKKLHYNNNYLFMWSICHRRLLKFSAVSAFKATAKTTSSAAELNQSLFHGSTESALSNTFFFSVIKKEAGKHLSGYMDAVYHISHLLMHFR